MEEFNYALFKETLDAHPDFIPSSLANEIGLSASAISQWGSGNSQPTFAHERHIERLLGVQHGFFRQKSRAKGSSYKLSHHSGSHLDLLQAMLTAIVVGWNAFKGQLASDLIKHTSAGKLDTKAFDLKIEERVSNSILKYDGDIGILTEEKGSINFDPEQTYTAILDPVDKSKFLLKLLEPHSHSTKTVGQLIKEGKFRGQMEGLEAPVSSITLLRNGVVLFNIVLDLLQGTVYVSSGKLIATANIERYGTPQAIADYGEEVVFLPRAGKIQGVTFLGDGESEKSTTYIQLHTALGFRTDHAPPTEHSEPGGPLRPYYLCDSLCNTRDPFRPTHVLYTGEKISEWISAISIVQSSSNLMAYELYSEQYSRDGLLMAPPPSYSSIQLQPGSPGRIKLDMAFLARFKRPNSYRGALLICHKDSTDIIDYITGWDNVRPIHPV